MIYGRPRIDTIFGPTAPEMGKTSKIFFSSFFFGDNNIGSNMIFKKKII